jgi:hypothetical protein
MAIHRPFFCSLPSGPGAETGGEPKMVRCFFVRKTEGLPSGYLTVRHGKSPFLIGKPSINGPFSMAMLIYWRVMANMS